jgi:hypothetical protein
VSVLGAYGITVCPQSRCQVQRYDLAADLSGCGLAEQLRGVALMAALSRIELPRLKRTVTNARESARVQTVQWLHQSKVSKAGQVKRSTRVTAYQKADELRERLGIEPDADSIVRIEFRMWPEAAKRRSPSELAYDDLRPQLAAYFARYDLGNLLTAHPSDVVRLLAMRVGEMELRGKRSDGTPRVLTPRVAERMSGTMLVLLAGLEDTLWTPQTKRARKAEMRTAGVLARDEDTILDAPPTDLGEYLRLVIAAFDPPAPARSPPLASPNPPRQGELPGMPARRPHRSWK